MSIFGSLPIGTREIACLLIDRTESEAAELQASGLKEYRAWTLAVKRLLTLAGNERNLEVLCSGGPSPDHCEWLLDIVCWDRGENGLRIALACESEWLEDPEEVIWDFQKLLCIKAPLKVLIYAGGPTVENRGGKRIRDRIEREMRAFAHHIRGEEYLFVSLDVAGGYAHLVQIERDGRDSNIELKMYYGRSAQRSSCAGHEGKCSCL